MSNLRHLVIFIIIMWSLMILGCWILVEVVAPINIECCGGHGMEVSSVLKAAVTIALVVLWILILYWLKNIILHRVIKR